MEPQAIPIATAIYTSLRAEILEKMKFSNQLASYKLLSVGAVIAFLASKHGDLRPFFRISSIIIGVGLAISFDLLLYHNNKTIINVGSYMKGYLEPWMKYLSLSSSFVMWEEYISKGDESRRVYNIFEIVNYLMTFLVIALALIYLWPPNIALALIYLWPPNNWGFVFALIMLAAEVVLVYKGLRR